MAESNGSLPSGLWFTSLAGWLPRTGISFGTLCSVIEYGLPVRFLLSEARRADCGVGSWRGGTCPLPTNGGGLGSAISSPAGSGRSPGRSAIFPVCWRLQAAYSASLLRVNRCRSPSIWQQAGFRQSRWWPEITRADGIIGRSTGEGFNCPDSQSTRTRANPLALKSSLDATVHTIGRFASQIVIRLSKLVLVS